MNNQQISEISVFLAKFKNRIWLFGILSWLFGITDRSIASFADGYLSAIDLMQLFTALLFFASWLYLKPEQSAMAKLMTNTSLVNSKQLSEKGK